jgi:GxxExxY protein
MKLLHEDLTYQIRSCIYEVRQEIGTGFDEETYHQGLILSFHRHDLPFASKEKRALMHRGMLVRNFVNDFLLFDKIILSGKCVPCKFLRAHYVQLFAELKLWKKDLGLIVNFGLPTIEIERYAFTEKEPVFVENYEFIENQMTKAEQQVLEGIKNIDQIDIANMQSYLKALGLGIGIFVNFGKSEVQISGVRPS